MELEQIIDLSVNELAELLEKHGLKEEIVEVFKVAAIDGDIFATLTGTEIGDMFMTMKEKRSAITAWSEITGMSFGNDGNPVQPSIKRRRILESDDEECDGVGASNSALYSPSSSSNSDVLEVTSAITSTPKTAKSVSDSNTSISSSSSSSDSSYQNWLKNYKLPNRFSCAVDAGLKKHFLTPNLINEMMRDICTSIQNCTRGPNKREREAVAMMIIEAYPFLKAPQISQETKPWGSLEVKIQNRFKKLQRNKTQKDTESEKAKTTGKPKTKQKKSWMAVPTAEESEEEIANAIQEIKQEWKKTRKEHGKIKELMDKTYAKRRELVLIEVQPLQEVLKMFPPLQNMLYIKADLGRVLGNSDLANEMKHNFKDIWSSRLLAYTKQDKKHQKVFEEMSAAIDSGCEEEECNERAALKLASIILKPPNKRGGQRKDYEEAVMKIIPDQHSLDDQIKAVIQPAIIITQDIYNSDILYVVAEGMVLSTITTKKIADAIVV